MKRIISTFILALILAACGGGGSDDPAAPAVVVLAEHRSAAGSISTPSTLQSAVLKSAYTNNGSQTVKLRIVASVVGLQAAPAANVDHAVLFLNIVSGAIPLSSKVVLSASASKQDGNLVFDVNVPPGLAIEVKLDAVLIAKNGNATMTWDSMFLQLQDGK